MNEFVGTYGIGDFTNLADIDGDVWAEFGVVSQPAWAFINDDGSVETRLGGLGLDGITEAAQQLIDG